MNHDKGKHAPSRFTLTANFKGYPYSYACFEKVEKGKEVKLLDSISEVFSPIDVPEI